MDRRLILHEALLAVADRVYFEPPATIQMTYPCVVYSRTAIDKKYANNQEYNQRRAYNVTVIDRAPDSKLVDDISAFPLCSFSSHFVTDNLHHDVFTIYA